MEDAGREDTLFNVYSDPDSRVRNAAVTALEGIGGAKTSKFLQRAAETDSSYLVVASCVRGLFAVDSSRGVELALRYVESESYRDILRGASLSVLRQTTDPRAMASGLKYSAAGYPLDIRLSALRIVAKLGREDRKARALMQRFLGDGNTMVRSAAARGLGEWGGGEEKRMLEQRMEMELDPDVLNAIRDALQIDWKDPTR